MENMKLVNVAWGPDDCNILEIPKDWDLVDLLKEYKKAGSKEGFEFDEFLKKRGAKKAPCEDFYIIDEWSEID